MTQKLRNFILLFLSIFVSLSSQASCPGNYTTLSASSVVSGNTVIYSICYPSVVNTNVNSGNFSIYIAIENAGPGDITTSLRLCSFRPDPVDFPNIALAGGSAITSNPAFGNTTFVLTGPSICSGDGVGDFGYATGIVAGGTARATINLQATAPGTVSWTVQTVSNAGTPTINSLFPSITIVNTPCPLITANSVLGATACSNGGVTGNLNNFVTGGSSPYTFTTAAPVNGTVSVDGSGVYTFTPSIPGPGTGSFNYQAADIPGCLSNTGTITVPIAQGPVAGGSILYTTTFNTPVVGTLNFTGGTAPFTITTNNISNGNVVYNSLTAQFTFTQTNPGASFFDYTVTDANGCVINETPNIYIYSCQPGNNITAALDEPGENTIYSFCYPGTVYTNIPFQIVASISNPDPNNSHTFFPFLDLIPDSSQPQAAGLDYLGNDGVPAGTLLFTAGSQLNAGGMGGLITSSGPVPPETSYVLTMNILPTITGMQNYTAMIQSQVNVFLPLTMDVVSCPTITAGDASFTGCTNFLTGSLLPFVTGGVEPYTFTQAGVSTCDGVSFVLGSTGGAFIYTPPTGFTGTCSFQYAVSDTNGCTSALGTVTLSTVVGVIANDGVASTCENNNIIGGTLSASGGTPPYTFAIVTNGTLGTAIITDPTNGIFNYLPDPDTFGIDSFTFQVTDSTGCVSNIGTVTITLNQTPITSNEQINDCVNTPTSGNLSELVSGGNPPYTFGSTGVQIGGTVTIDGAGNYTFVPNIDFSGSGQFGYQVSDSNGCFSSGIVDVTIASPSAGGTAVNTCFDVPISGDLSSLATGGFPPYVFGLTGVSVGGDATVDGSGIYNFVPAVGFSGPGSFEYQVTDSNGCVAVADVTINVDSLAASDGIILSCVESFSSNLNNYVNGGSGSLTFTGPLSQSCLEATTIINTDGSFSYSVPDGFTAPCDFVYQVTDAQGCVSTGIITVTVEEPTAATVEVNDCVDTTITGDLTSLFTGVPPFTFSLTGNVLNGTASVGSNGIYTFTPTAGFSGPAGFEYEAIDSNGCSATGAVDITVASPIISPTAINSCLFDSVFGDLAPLVTSGFPPYVFSLTGLPVGGDVTVNEDGSYEFTPNFGFSGPGGFDYVVTDSNDCVSTGNVSINVDSLSTNATSVQTCNQALTGTLLDYVNGGTGPLVFEQVALSCGEVTVNADGSFIYTAPIGFTGPCTIFYNVSDSLGCFSSGSLTVVANLATEVLDSTNTLCLGGSVSGTLADLIVGSPQPPFTFAIVTQPIHGTISNFNSSTGAYTYTPSAGYIGTDSFQFQLTDGNDCVSNIGTVTITVVSCCPLSNDPIMRLILQQYWGFSGPSGL